MDIDAILIEQIRALQKRNAELAQHTGEGTWDEFRKNCETMLHLTTSIVGH